MPELPEVETFARQIRPLVLNKLVDSVTVTEKGLRMVAPSEQSEVTKFLVGRKIQKILRHGKFLIFKLDNDNSVVAHLRMSGRLTVTRNAPDTSPHNRIYIKFDDASYLNFLDARRFGTFHLVLKDKEYPGVKRLGLDALDGNWSAGLLKKTFSGHNKIIYRMLLDQNIIAGIGNIYANESLFLSKIHPLKPANMISEPEAGILLKNIVSILNSALKFKGTTLIDNSYFDSEGSKGSFSEFLQVYGRESQTCIICKGQIKRMRISNRSVYYCALCQRL